VEESSEAFQKRTDLTYRYEYARNSSFEAIQLTNLHAQASAAVTSSRSKTGIIKDNADEEGRQSQRISKRKADDLEGNTVVVSDRQGMSGERY
jgi:hypothetical protein